MKKNRAALTRDTHRVHISKDDFSDTVKFIDAAKKAAIGSDEFHALLLAAIAMYAKPFGRNELSETAAAVPTLKVKGLQLLALLGPKGAALHRRIRRLRNKVSRTRSRSSTLCRSCRKPCRIPRVRTRP
jgi:hypothetical protein